MPAFSITENSNKVAIQLDRLPNDVRLAIKKQIEAAVARLLPMVRAAEPHRTGRLRAATRSFVDDRPERNYVRGRVRVIATGRASREGATYGALEYGSTGRPFPVRGYSRRGYPVRGYSRVGGITARRFLRGPAAAVLPRVRAEIEQALRTLR